MQRFAVVVATLLCACGNARVLHQDPTGGVIELDGDPGKALRKANELMEAHCGPNNFTVIQQGDEPTAGGGKKFHVHYYCGAGPVPLKS
ncbi:MAG TPA: hypothetical protein VGM56_07800 [Byssovorax sp.]